MGRQRKRLRMGRPRRAPELVRRHRVTIMLRDDEFARLERLADSMDSPIGTAAYELVARSLKRMK
jgi:hypothetical protein